MQDDSGGLTIRRESPAAAIELDRKMQRVWEGHPKHCVIENRGTFAEKLEAAASAVLKIAHESHPQEWDKAIQKVKSSTPSK